MAIRQFRHLLMAVLLLGILPPAHAFGPLGHRYVGSIADQLLSSRAQAEVKKILGMSLQEASTRLDCVKEVSGPPNFKYTSNPRYNASCVQFENPTAIAEMEDYVKRNWSNCKRGPGEDVCHRGYHYSDVDFHHDHYDRSYTGTSDHDIVSAITAAIAVLHGKQAPVPFSIKDQREALFLLAHLIGDLHQPLHVGAVYLDSNDQPFDPDAPGHKPDLATETRGGNSIELGGSNLHGYWDAVSRTLDPDNVKQQALDLAKAVPVTNGDPVSWPVVWATDTLIVAKEAFTGIAYSHPGTKAKWKVTFESRREYAAMERRVKAEQLVKAGARLAQVLNVDWR